MYATARAAPRGGIRHGQEAVLTQAEIPLGPGSTDRGEDPGADCQAVWRAPQFPRFVEENLPGERAELFSEDKTLREYERRIAELERLLGKKEVEIALPRNFLGRNG